MKNLLTIGAALGALAVILGAFGAHALKARLTPDQLLTYETAVRYQMYHAFAILAAGLIAERLASALALKAGWFFVAGIALFSGSLYGLVFTGWKWLGPVTPLGGLTFIIGWILLAVAAARGRAGT